VYAIKNNIDKDFFKYEFYRLTSLFLPWRVSDLPEVDINLVSHHEDRHSAKCFLEDSKIEFYLDYHLAHPDDYKVTLLHEAGHFLYGNGHSFFKTYFDILSVRQKFIEELVIPDSYEEFLYGRPFNSKVYTFMCSGCRKSKITRKADKSVCIECDRDMLLVSGL